MVNRILYFKPLLLSILLLLSIEVAAKNCGTQGSLYPILEENALTFIEKRLLALHESGKLKEHQQEMQTKALKSLERPKKVFGLTPTQKPRVFEKDLNITLTHDIKGTGQTILYKAGTRINALEKPLLHTKKALIFLDGDDAKQLQWALQERQKRKGLAKLVLVNGPVLALMRTYHIPFYFDQSGHLTRYFGFAHIPAVVYQEGPKLMVSEVKI